MRNGGSTGPLLRRMLPQKNNRRGLLPGLPYGAWAGVLFLHERNSMTDVIAAISTALSPSGIGIVRMSGGGAMDVLYRIYRSKTGRKDIREAFSHTIHYGYVVDEGTVIDEVLIMWMKGPRTYTGEDTVEIDCHGGVLAVQRVLDTVLKYGARLAEPGEFSKRAFLNGKIDLSEAEAVMDVIQAGSGYALHNSLQQLRGSVRHAVTDMRKKILYHMAYIESALDDPEHFSLEGYAGTLKSVLVPIGEQIRRLIESFDDGRLLREGIRTVILGKPNAGKSSVLNMLLGEERAIVTDIAGTTRDVLEEQIMLGGISLRLADTAGIRDTDNPIEQIGVERARQYAGQADLILFVLDSSLPFDEDDIRILDSIQDKKYIILLNKTDLKARVMPEDIRERTDRPVILFSAKEGRGLEELEDLLKEMFFSGGLSFEEEIYITNSRHKQELTGAEECIRLVMGSIDDGMPEDFYFIDLMGAYEHLGNIIGESAGEDLVNEIFSKFCVGK